MAAVRAACCASVFFRQTIGVGHGRIGGDIRGNARGQVAAQRFGTPKQRDHFGLYIGITAAPDG